MLLSESSIGELYSSLDPGQYKKLTKYIKNRYEGEMSLSLRLHNQLISWLEKNQFNQIELEAIKYKLFKDKDAKHSRLTSQINILQTIFKEFVLLSKINDKNIYTETLWGEYLIENRLKRNLLIKLNNYKLDIFKDDYPFQKDFYHKREQLFLSYFNSSIKNRNKIFTDANEQIKSFHYFELISKIDFYNTLISFKDNNLIPEIVIREIKEIINFGINSKLAPIVINSLVLRLSLDGTIENYLYLKKEFVNSYHLFKRESTFQIIAVILNYGLVKLDKGEQIYSIENYNFYLFLEENEILFSKSFFNQNHMNRYITLCIKHDSSQRARTILKEHINKLPKTQIESCYNLNLAKIEFAEKNYKQAVRLLYQINTNQNLFYLPLTKILLLKNLVELEDIERLTSEKENFYKYYHTSKTLPENIKKKYALYNKYIEHMFSLKYEFMSEYKRKKISIALQDDSPYFIEKNWMKGRWKRLQEKFGE